MKAAKWNRWEAKAGDKRAQLRLARQYLNGQGVPRDMVSAYMWASLAESAGVEAATRFVDELEGRMSSSQLQEVQTLARTRFTERSPQ